MSGINLPGPLRFGDLPTTPSVQIGVGGVLTVSNTTGTPSVSVSGPLTSSSLTVTGTIQVPDQSGTAPGMTFSASDPSTGFNRAAASTVGFYSGGADALRFGASLVQSFKPLALGSNTLSCGTLTTAALSAPSIVDSGTLSSGTSAATCAALTSASVTSSGAVSQPAYSIRVYRSATQSVAQLTVTAAAWDTLETTGGGASNWTAFSPPATLITIPVAGTYAVTYTTAFALNTSGARDCWVEINPSGGVPGSGRRYNETSTVTTPDGAWCQTSTFKYRFAANDTIVLAVYQSSGGNLNLLGLTGGQTSSLSVVRVYS